MKLQGIKLQSFGKIGKRMPRISVSQVFPYTYHDACTESSHLTGSDNLNRFENVTALAFW